MTEKEILLTAILNCSRSSLYTGDASLDVPQRKRLSQCLLLRAQGIPLQYILGETEFFGLRFKVDNQVFIPRPETEILVETALKQIADCRLQIAAEILDVGTGSGCIAVSLAKFLPYAQISALDSSADALAVAEENAILNGVAKRINFIQSDLLSAIRPHLLRQAGNLPSAFDLIISNPPYIPTKDIKGLQREIHCEPHIALDGGCDGLDFYRRIIKEAPQFLKRDGLLMMEMGYNQSLEIKNIFEKMGNFEIIEVVKDYQGIERVIGARKNG